MDANSALFDPRIPAERTPPDLLARQSHAFAAVPHLRTVLDAVPAGLLVLNSHRQVIFANRSLAALLGLVSPDAVHGQRPGEILGCEHAFDGTCDGCGTTEACSACGAAKAIAICERGAAAVQECRVTQRESGRGVDLRIATTPLELDGYRFTIVSLTDISGEKRRQALERIFFHDLLNTAGAVMGYAQLLRGAPAEEVSELSAGIVRLTVDLADEVRAQRELSAAESGELIVRWEPVSSRGMLQDVAESYRRHAVAEQRQLMVDERAVDVAFSSDRRLLQRVIGNMAKNALEASPAGQSVTLSCQATPDTVEFQVHNLGTMPRPVQLQVFQRSFSTKGSGRGLGTYSIKLLSERYLKGSVGFTTSEEAGTTFYARYPRKAR